MYSKRLLLYSPKNCNYLDFFGPNGIRFARCNFRAQKSLDFQGPPLPVALQMDFPPSKSLRPAPYIYKQQVYYCSAQIVRIFFINLRPACSETEKSGEGERDTGTTSGKGVTRHVARGYLRTYSPDRWRGAGESSPPPHVPLPFLDNLRLQRQISRIASSLEVVSMIADIGQQQ
jgi:hypothetical protein